ncbi:MAG TPA: 16S rRNA (uracil(1498)-N(3))-methyltransferase [Gammaproteobacteria bacterium]|nr:16S rRNA (uracil(1498)-N(3))-methyltransferase [Gammaproteobacteria bacterium]
MRIPRIYDPAATTPGDAVELNPAAARHAVKVLRLAPGAPLILFDGRGHAFSAHLESCKPALARLDAALQPDVEPPLRIELLQALSRGAKMDLVVQKAVELGVESIVPVVTERSVMRLDAAGGEKKRAHWESVAIGACEQCGRNRLPTIHAPVELNAALTAEGPVLQLLLDPEADAGLPSEAAPEGVRLLIGAEGGLTDAERAAALAAGFRPMRFGPRVLRTETAAVAALAVIQYQWGDLN